MKCKIQSCDFCVVPKSIESVIWAVYSEYRCTGVGLGDASVSLKNYDFGPNLVVYLVPFVQHFLDVILKNFFFFNYYFFISNCIKNCFDFVIFETFFCLLAIIVILHDTIVFKYYDWKTSRFNDRKWRKEHV